VEQLRASRLARAAGKRERRLPGRIEVYNPGTFPEGFTQHDYIAGAGKSIQRTPLRACILYCSTAYRMLPERIVNIGSASRADQPKAGFPATRIRQGGPMPGASARAA